MIMMMMMMMMMMKEKKEGKQKKKMRLEKETTAPESGKVEQGTPDSLSSSSFLRASSPVNFVFLSLLLPPSFLLLPFVFFAGDERTREAKVLELLQNSQALYDDHHAMVLTQIYDFKPGILYLYEKAKQFQQIVQYYMEKNAYSGS